MKTKLEIYTGDCLDKLKLVKSASVDVIVTSPPYNIGMKYDFYKDKVALVEYLQFMDKVTVELKRVLKSKGSFFINLGGTNINPFLPLTMPLQIAKHFVLQNVFVWVKSIAIEGKSIGHYKPINSNRFVNLLHEYIYQFTKTGNIKINRLAIGTPYADKTNVKRRGHKQDLKCLGSTWFIPFETRNKKLLHPASYPIRLPLNCIKLHGKKNPVVLDCFGGTFSTGVAAIQSKASKFIGIELSADYVKLGKLRLKQALEE